MSTSLSFLFDQFGDLKPEFRKHEPLDEGLDEAFGHNLIPDWEKVEQAIFGTSPRFRNMSIQGDQPQETAGAGIPESPGVLMPSLGAIHGGLPNPPLQEYTVILQHPYYFLRRGPDKFTGGHVLASTVREAIEHAQQQALEANRVNENDTADLWTVVACIPGHHSNLAT